jgi:hypothetical protein
LTSIRSSFPARDSASRSTTGASEAGSTAFAGSRTQRASTEADGPFGCWGAGIMAVPDFLGRLFERDLTPAGIVDTMVASHHD